jgi:hypothetical protein
MIKMLMTKIREFVIWGVRPAILRTLLRDPGFPLIVSQQGIHTRGYSNPGLADSP